MFACASEAEALALRDDLARAHWARELPDTPPPATDIGKPYFTALAARAGDNEYFEIDAEACDLARFTEAAPPTRPPHVAPDGAELVAIKAQYAARARLRGSPPPGRPAGRGGR